MHAIGDKRGSERVAGITLIVEAVEGEDASGQLNRSWRDETAGSFAWLSAFGANVRPRLASFVDRQDLVALGVAQAIEEAPATERVAPALGKHALRIGSEIKKVRPIFIGDSGRISGPRDMRLAAIAELDLRARHAPIGAIDQQHDSALNARLPRRRLRR